MPCLQVDYGYDESFGRTGQEKGLLYIQRRQHNPLSEAGGRLDYAKSLARWYAEVHWQEGFETTWPGTDPLEQADNEDGDGETLAPAMYWWDMRQSHETLNWADVPLGLCAGNISIAAGIPYKILFYKHPRGRVHGLKLLTVDGVTSRSRSETGAVDFYGSSDGGATWSLLEQPDTDEHGRWRSAPVREKDWAYRVAGHATIWYVVNRSYTTVLVTIPPATSGGQAVAMFAHPAGRVIWTVWIDGDDIKAAETLTGKVTLGTVRTIDTSGDYDSVYAETDGNTVYVDGRRTADHKLCRWYSDDYGETWTGPVVIS